MTFTFFKRSFMGVIVITCFCVAGYSQGQDRVIEKESWRSEPIRIVKLQTKIGTVELRKKFTDDEDWLKGFAVTVQNVSDKAIARVVLRLDFPRPDGSSENQATYETRIMWGLDPAVAKDEALTLMQPGERVEAKLVEANLLMIRSDLKDLGYPAKIDRVRLLVDFVIFADRSMWNAGEILYPDPADPTRWINPKHPRSSGQALNRFSAAFFRHLTSRGCCFSWQVFPLSICQIRALELHPARSLHKLQRELSAPQSTTSLST